MRFLLFLLALVGSISGADESLKISVYATAGGIEHLLKDQSSIADASGKMRKLGVTRVVLEGRRGDEYVSPERLAAVKQELASHGLESTGGIATVPGNQFGTRQNTTLGWLNWETKATQNGIREYFRTNAAVFDELVLDDFFCTADTSPVSEAARRGRDWGAYRQDLLAGLSKSIVLEPARAAKPNVRMVIKYPQWYDMFHLYGYDPERMSRNFDAIWVGTEVRNPKTQRMGYVQPTEGYINYLWLNAVSGGKAEVAWFDHIECTGQNFVDQAWQSVLAGAPELILFNLFDVVNGHEGHVLFERALPAMREVAQRIKGKVRDGVAYYKPVNSDPGDNRYLMDYLAMLGIPVVPTAEYPFNSRSVLLGVQAAKDPNLMEKVANHLRSGAKVAMTASLMERIKAPEGVVRVDLRTFSDQDFLDAGEWLLAPKELPFMKMSQQEVDALRNNLGVELSGPSDVAYYRFGNEEAFYSFRDRPSEMKLRGKKVRVPAHSFVWVR